MAENKVGHIGELLSVVLASVGAGLTADLIIKTIVVTVITTVIGGVGGFFINRWLKNIYKKKDGA